MKLLTLLSLLILTACGSPTPSSTGNGGGYDLSSYNCKLGNYSKYIESVSLKKNDIFVLDDGYCISSGTYKCDENTGKITVVIDAIAPDTGYGVDFTSHCQPKGSYSCLGTWESGTLGAQFSISCDGSSSNYLSVVRSYTFDIY